MYEEIIDKIKLELEKALNYFKNELTKVRTARVSTSLIESVEVELSGKKFPLKSLGQIVLAGSREILIQPWDQSYLEPIRVAVLKSPLGISVNTEKDRIRISFPALSGEVREGLVKLLSQKTENARRIVRHWRTEGWREIQDGFTVGEITEDDKYRARDKLQELVDEYNEKIEEMSEKKKKEIME